MILKLKSFIQIGTFIFHKKFHTTRVPVNFLDETRFSTSIYHLDTPLGRYNTRKYSLGELILLAKSKEYTLFYMPDKFQGVWMTKTFRGSVFDRSLSTYNCYSISSWTRKVTTSMVSYQPLPESNICRAPGYCSSNSHNNAYVIILKRWKWFGLKVLSNTDHMTPIPFGTFCYWFHVMTHDIVNFQPFAAKTWEVFFSSEMWPTHYDLQFLHHFTMKCNVFSLNLTGDSVFFLFTSTQNKLSMKWKVLVLFE